MSEYTTITANDIQTAISDNKEFALYLENVSLRRQLREVQEKLASMNGVHEPDTLAVGAEHR